MLFLSLHFFIFLKHACSFVRFPFFSLENTFKEYKLIYLGFLDQLKLLFLIYKVMKIESFVSTGTTV